MNLAGRNLLQDKTRLILSVAGVALAIMLILILTGFVSGLNLQSSGISVRSRPSRALRSPTRSARWSQE